MLEHPPAEVRDYLQVTIIGGTFPLATSRSILTLTLTLSFARSAHYNFLWLTILCNTNAQRVPQHSLRKVQNSFPSPTTDDSQEILHLTLYGGSGPH